MSTTAPDAPLTTLDVSATPPVPFGRLVGVELRKAYDTRAGFWLVASIGILVAIVQTFVLVASLIEDQPLLFDDFASIAGGITSLLLPVLAIMLVTGEWSQRSAMVSFALEPRRIRVVLAKLAVSALLAVATLVFMLVTAVVMTGIAEVAQPDLTSFTFEASTFITFGVVQLLTMAIGFALGALLLNTPLSIVVFFLYWYLLPGILFAVGQLADWLGNALEWVNFQAAVGPLVDGDSLTGEDVGKLLVSLVIWLVVPLTFGIRRILRAEVK